MFGGVSVISRLELALSRCVARCGAVWRRSERTATGGLIAQVHGVAFGVAFGGDSDGSPAGGRLASPDEWPTAANAACGAAARPSRKGQRHFRPAALGVGRALRAVPYSPVAWPSLAQAWPLHHSQRSAQCAPGRSSVAESPLRPAPRTCHLSHRRGERRPEYKMPRAARPGQRDPEGPEGPEPSRPIGPVPSGLWAASGRADRSVWLSATLHAGDALRARHPKR